MKTTLPRLFLLLALFRLGGTLIPAGEKKDDDDGELVKTVKSVNQARTKLHNLNVLRQHAMGAHFGAAETRGKFPADLAAVRAAGELDADLKLTDTNDGKKGVDPIYFSGHGDSTPGNTILFAAPFQNPDGTRTVAQVDGAVVHIPEADFQAKTKPKE